MKNISPEPVFTKIKTIQMGTDETWNQLIRERELTNMSSSTFEEGTSKYSLLERIRSLRTVSASSDDMIRVKKVAQQKMGPEMGRERTIKGTIENK